MSVCTHQQYSQKKKSIPDTIRTILGILLRPFEALRVGRSSRHKHEGKSAIEVLPRHGDDGHGAYLLYVVNSSSLEVPALVGVGVMVMTLMVVVIRVTRRSACCGARQVQRGDATAKLHVVGTGESSREIERRDPRKG